MMASYRILYAEERFVILTASRANEWVVELLQTGPPVESRP